jgi:hypothetical protein
VNRVLPEIDARLIQMSLPAPQSMRDNISWFDNLNLSSAAKNTVQNNQTSFWQNDTLKAQQIKQDIRNPHLHKAHSLKQ